MKICALLSRAAKSGRVLLSIGVAMSLADGAAAVSHVDPARTPILPAQLEPFVDGVVARGDGCATTSPASQSPSSRTAKWC